MGEHSAEQFGTERLSAGVRQFSDREPEVIIADLYDSVPSVVEGRLTKTISLQS